MRLLAISWGTLAKQIFRKATAPVEVTVFPGLREPCPKLLEVSLEAEQGMVRTSASFFGVVPNSCSLGSAIDDNNDRVQVEDQSAPCVGKGKQMGPQAVVKPGQLADRFDR